MSGSNSLHFTPAVRPGPAVSQRDPFKLERRRGTRTPAEGGVAVSYSNGKDRFGITHLELLDKSAGGLGVKSRVPIEPGLTVTICPKGSTVAWMSALCVRCDACEDGYSVGLQYTTRHAA